MHRSLEQFHACRSGHQDWNTLSSEPGGESDAAMTRSAPAELTELGPVQFPPDASTDSRRRRQTLMIDPHRHGVAQQSCTNSNRSNREPRSTLRCAMGAPSDRRPLCGAFRAPMCSTPERSGPSQLRNAERTVVARCRSLDRTPLTIPIGGSIRAVTHGRNSDCERTMIKRRTRPRDSASWPTHSVSTGLGRSSPSIRAARAR